MEKIFQPQSLAELDEIIHQSRTELTYVAGATDLLVDEPRWRTAGTLVDLTSIPAIHEYLEATEDHTVIGAAVPLSQILTHPIIQQRLPLLVEACRQIGSVQIQNRATLGGNIANASPAGDSLPVLSVLKAEIWIGPRKDGEFEKRNIDQVMLKPGETCLKNNRYIAAIFIPFPGEEGQCWYFRKVGQRKSLAISKVSLAMLGWIRNKKVDEIRISTGSVTPQIKRATATEAILNHQILSAPIIEAARQSLMAEVTPITDIRSTSDYRKNTCGELLREALYRIMAED